jgi:predicted nucleotidyltransferase
MAKINTKVIHIIEEFLNKLYEHGIHVQKAYLFGSYAKGIENKWSDIDVAVISSDLSSDRIEERIRLTKIALDVDSRIEPVPFRPQVFTDEDPLAWQIKKEGIPVKPLPVRKSY